MSQQGDYERDHFSGRLQTVKCRALAGREGLAALPTEKPLLLARVNPDIALAYLASRRTRQIGTEDRSGVHEDSPLLALLGSMPRRSRSEPLFALQANLITV
jgi:hypothetical protein